VRYSHQNENLPSQSKLRLTIAHGCSFQHGMEPWARTAEIIFRAPDRITTGVSDSLSWRLLYNYAVDELPQKRAISKAHHQNNEIDSTRIIPKFTGFRSNLNRDAVSLVFDVD
jgi:hypothetical protein